ncbi:MAG: PBP1A family penicillin-binding protein [Patescibacteria group bacterium]|nr:PBP1A family penicillin-binding protein [Patescibacteria group bacterium]
MRRKLRRFVRICVVWAKNNRQQFFFLALIAALVVFVGIPSFTYLYFAKDLGSKETMITRNEAGVILLDRRNKPFYTLYDAKQREYVPISQISKNLQEAVIASEDRNFYNHPGFSPRGIIRAFTANVSSGGISQGASTITQQLVKNVLLTQERSFLRKFQEVVLAIEVDRRYTKDDILEMYLNAVYFGEGAFGAQQAAKTFFGKDAAELTVAESALLAGVLPAPSAFSPISGDREKAFKRQKTVLALMEEQGYITAAERQAAEREKISFENGDTSFNAVAPHFALMVKDQLIRKYGEPALSQSGYRIQTTLDLELQKSAQDAVSSHIKTLAAQKATNGAVVAIDPNTGEIRALVGSHNWNDQKNGKINMAIRPRQPGSSFKPLVYATAIEKKIVTAGTILEDKVRDFGGGYTPLNYDRTERGNIPLRRALALSLNTTAVDVQQRLGVAAMLEKAEELGITTLKKGDYGLSLVLGSGEVPLLQMTNTYAAFANEGEMYEPTAIIEIRDKRDRVIERTSVAPRRVFTREAAYIISSILSDAGARRSVFGTALDISRIAAVKTGTTNDYRDALTIGYTPQIVVGVWVGNNDNSAMGSVAGSLGAAPIWRRVMEAALVNQPVEWFSKPSGVVDVRICAETGELLEGFDDKKPGEKVQFRDGDKEIEYTATIEQYIRGTEPEKKCGPVTPSPDPTKEAEEKKKSEEEARKKREDKENKEREEKELDESDESKLPTATPTIPPTETPQLSITPEPVIKTSTDGPLSSETPADLAKPVPSDSPVP